MAIDWTDQDALLAAMTRVPRRVAASAGDGLLAEVVERMRPRPYQAGIGIWLVACYAISPKQGWSHKLFPLMWCDNGHWVAPYVDGDVAPGTMLWGSEADAYFDLHANYPPGERFLPGIMSFPSFDQRSRRGKNR